MPWKQSSVMVERTSFVLEAERSGLTIAELCRRYGITRPTAYRWIRRYEAEGLAGLTDRSRRPHRSPNATSSQVVGRLVAERKQRPHWGPKKLLVRLARQGLEPRLPARSTASAILKREGLVVSSPRRPRSGAALVSPLGEVTCANEVWCTDFKGEFRLGNGQLCYPLTLTDAFSRYLLVCQERGSTRGEQAKPLFERAFSEFGLPDRIRSDNGAPFGSSGLCGLSRLSVWWLKLGLSVERITPGKPQENGRHERMHRTLKAESTRPPSSTPALQQERFDGFCQEYNNERPHEALGGLTPAEVYQPSWKPYLKESPGLDYPAYFERRQVRSDGCIKWKGAQIFISEVLAHEPVGLVETDEDEWTVHICAVAVGTVRGGKFNPVRDRRLTSEVSSRPPGAERNV